MNIERYKNCNERIDDQLENRINDIKQLWDNWCKGIENDEELGNLNEYGLSLDYVEPNTFNDQPQGYIRYQLSCGGPSDEFRYYINPDLSVYRIEYWFLDWFDEANRVLYGEDLKLLTQIYEDWAETGTIRHLIDEATNR